MNEQKSFSPLLVMDEHEKLASRDEHWISKSEGCPPLVQGQALAHE